MHREGSPRTAATASPRVAPVALTARDAAALLVAAGFVGVRSRGGHVVFVHRDGRRYVLRAPGRPRADLPQFVRAGVAKLLAGAVPTSTRRRAEALAARRAEARA